MTRVVDPLAMLDGSVQSQGIRVSARDWLDMGSEEWAKTDNRVKAAAYQAALVTGWTEDGLRSVMTHAWGPRVDDDVATFVLALLRELAEEFPVQVEDVYKVEPERPEMRLHKGGEPSNLSSSN